MRKFVNVTLKRPVFFVEQFPYQVKVFNDDFPLFENMQGRFGYKLPCIQHDDTFFIDSVHHCESVICQLHVCVRYSNAL